MLSAGVGEIGDERAIEPLRKLLKDEFLSVQIAVYVALEKLKKK